MFDSYWKNVAVIGAAGKMGRGITLLILQEMARLNAQETAGKSLAGYHLHVIDADTQALDALRKYLRKQLTVYAEKNINTLRSYYASNEALVSNGDIISSFVEAAMDFVLISTDLMSAKGSKLVFEAVIEDLEVKKKVFKSLKEVCDKETVYFTNTSSIPINVINDACGLQHRLIGFHFYNPPPIQKLVELVFCNPLDLQLEALAHDVGKRLKKTLIQSKDVAGFIGNGHFIREIAFACRQVDKLQRDMSLSQAIYTVNQVTKDFLLRPMGIFQLMDYVGLDVCSHIAHTMGAYIPHESFKAPLVEKMAAEGHKGGQNFDGSQREGFFQYQQLDPVGLYDFDKKSYVTLSSLDLKIWNEKIGPLPESGLSWKSLSREKEKAPKLKAYFLKLQESKSFGAELAKDFLNNSQNIGKQLVESSVAQQIADVDAVLENGFFHFYGPSFSV